MAVNTDDDYFRALTKGYWASALCDRYEYHAGKQMAEDAVNGLKKNSGDACIVKGDIYYGMAVHDSDRKDHWVRKQHEEYNKIPSEDERYKVYFKAVPTEANDLELGAISHGQQPITVHPQEAGERMDAG
jgi:hypothetical protein